MAVSGDLTAEEVATVTTPVAAAIVAASREADTAVAATGAAAAEARLSIAVEITMQITRTKASRELRSNRTEWTAVCLYSRETYEIYASKAFQTRNRCALCASMT